MKHLFAFFREPRSSKIGNEEIHSIREIEGGA